jgi:hypothetical protein
LAARFIHQKILPEDINILSGYTAQTALIKKMIALMGREKLSQVTVSTIDAYQGEESSVVTTSIQKTYFAAETNRSQLSLSRESACGDNCTVRLPSQHHSDTELSAKGMLGRCSYE